MKYFLDTEFIEKPDDSGSAKGSIDLISIGIVDEAGETLYCIHSDFDETQADDWVKENVLEKLEDDERLNREQIKDKILKFVGDDDDPVFYAYYCCYDWVVFCWIFGKMIDLPKNYPMYCKDIQCIVDTFGIDKEKLPKQESGHHNALADAQWNKEAYDFIVKDLGALNEVVENI